MTAPIYSTQFIAASVNSTAASTASGYTVPIGKVAIIREVDLLALTAGTLLVGYTRPTESVWILSSEGVVAYQARHLTTRVVVPAGFLIRTAWTSGNHHVSVSGYLLSAV